MLFFDCFLHEIVVLSAMKNLMSTWPIKIHVLANQPVISSMFYLDIQKRRHLNSFSVRNMEFLTSKSFFHKLPIINPNAAFVLIFKIFRGVLWNSMREKWPYLEIFWSVFSRIRSGYGELLLISPYSV